MSKNISIILAIIIILVTGYFVLGNSTSNTNGNQSTVSEKNSEIKNGVQYININAQGGYSPRVSSVQAGMPTKLIVKTNGTYDCSAALVIRSIGYRKMLPPKGETEIDLGIPKAGDTLQGVCAMGMYSFVVKFG